MPIGLILLLVLAVLIYFGLLQRILDRMKMSDKLAIVFIGAMIVGSFLPNIPIGMGLAINVGGGLIPIVIALYIIVTSETSEEKVRAITASVITGIIIYIMGRILPAEPDSMFVDPIIAFSIVAGIVSYIFGRSRRGAFVSGILGIVINDVINAIGIVNRPIGTVIGGAGVLDAVVISAVIAVGLCEITGEAREKLQGGTSKVKIKKTSRDNDWVKKEGEKDE